MKTILTLCSILILSGCTTAKTEITSTDPKTGIVTVRKTKIYSFFSTTALEGLDAGRETKTGSSLLSIKKSGTETEVEKLNSLLESVVAGAVKGAK